jgi:16S rRNA (guanine527-N7)-methyltransferase
MKEAELLQLGEADLGIILTQDSREKLLSFIELMHKWNKVYNLTAIKNKGDMVRYHLLDSLAVLPYLWAGRWLDVGCGGGVPGLVLAVAAPSWEFTLVDSNNKKISFVQQVVIELGLKNVKVHLGRVEELELDHKFDGIISRAFSELDGFFRMTRHLLAPFGHWVAMKGEPKKEIYSIPIDCEIERVIPLRVPGLNAARSLVIAKASEGWRL